MNKQPRILQNANAPLVNHAVEAGLEKAAANSDALRQLLDGARARVAAAPKPRAPQPVNNFSGLPQLSRIGADGVDHINFSNDATTTLGQALSLMSDLGFEHDRAGEFMSMEGFWFYTRSVDRPAILRNATGRNARTFSKRVQLNSFTPNFRAIILNALWQKVVQHSALAEVLADSTRPFEYYTKDSHTKLMERPIIAPWLMYGMEIIRTAVRADKQPNLYPFMEEEIRGRYYKTPHAHNHQANQREIEVVNKMLDQFFAHEMSTKVEHAPVEPAAEVATHKNPQGPGKKKKNKSKKQSAQGADVLIAGDKVYLNGDLTIEVVQPLDVALATPINVTVFDAFDVTTRSWGGVSVDVRRSDDERGSYKPDFEEITEVDVLALYEKGFTPEQVSALVYLVYTNSEGKETTELVARSEILAWKIEQGEDLAAQESAELQTYFGDEHLALMSSLNCSVAQKTHLGMTVVKATVKRASDWFAERQNNPPPLPLQLINDEFVQTFFTNVDFHGEGKVECFDTQRLSDQTRGAFAPVFSELNEHAISEKLNSFTHVFIQWEGGETNGGIRIIPRAEKDAWEAGKIEKHYIGIAQNPPVSEEALPFLRKNGLAENFNVKLNEFTVTMHVKKTEISMQDMVTEVATFLTENGYTHEVLTTAMALANAFYSDKPNAPILVVQDGVISVFEEVSAEMLEKINQDTEDKSQVVADNKTE